MSRLIESLDRLLPSLLMASGVMLLAAGALAYAPATPNGTPASPAGGAAGDPLFASSVPVQSALPQPTAAGSPIDIGPSPAPLPSASSAAALGYASRIVIPSLNIDLPVVAGDLQVPGNADGYPLCDVAMYMPGFVQPGDPGTTYIYAHAQKGMFLPLLRGSLIDGGAQMVGALVEVFTTTDELHLYQISVVKQHATDLSLATQNGTTEQLVLQTSEGPSGTVPKLQIAATPVSTVPAQSVAAIPSAAPRVCLPPTAQP